MSNGAELIAKTVSVLGIATVFGVEDPTTNPLLELFKSSEVDVIRLPSQKTASFASIAYGYVKSLPAVLLVSGNGQFLECLSALPNAQEQRWPLIVITVSDDERDFSHLSSSFTKYHQRCSTADSIPKFLIQAFKYSINGRAGPTHVHFNSSIMSSPLQDHLKQTIRNPYTKFLNHSFLPVSDKLDDTVFLLTKARNPLIVVGKTASSSSNVHIQLRSLVQNFHLPFVVMPMARGTLSDFSQHSFTVVAKESIENSDFLLLVGTSLKELSQNNLGFNSKKKKVKVIQIDNVPEEIEDEIVPSIDSVYELALVGDLHDVLEGLNEKLQTFDYIAKSPPANLLKLRDQAMNTLTKLETAESPESSVNLYSAFKSIRDAFQDLQDDVYNVLEGFDSLGGVTSLLCPVFLPKQLIDVSSFPVPGNGLIYAMALKAIEKTRLSVFFFRESTDLAFSVADLITSTAINLPVMCIVFNETKSVRYDLLCQSLGIDGLSALKSQDLEESLKQGIQIYLDGKRSVLIDIQIEPPSETDSSKTLVPKM